MAESAPRVFTAIVVATALLVGFAILGPLADISSGFTEQRTREAVLLDGSGVTVALDDATGTDETVWKTTGFAVNLTGANDSFVESDSGIDVTDDSNFTISLWAYVDAASANADMTALSVNGRVVITYNGSAGNWSVWYYDDGSRDSYQVNVSTTGNETGNFTHIIAWSNSTHLTVYRNNTQGEIQNITTTSVAGAPVNATNWDGRLEEVRTFGEAANATNRSELFNSPVDGQPDLNRTARIMFDQPDRTTQLILFTAAELTQSNVTFSSGFAEQVMTEDTALNSGDYNWFVEGPNIEPVAGGQLADAPVAYVSYTFEEAQDEAVELIGQGMVFGAVVVILLFVGMVLRVIRQL